MTTIACKIYEKEIHLVSDTRVSYENEGITKSLYLEKIIINNDIYFGVCGKASAIVFLDVFSKTNIPSGSTVKDIVDYLHKFFKMLFIS